MRRCSTCVTHCAPTPIGAPASCSSESSTRGSTTTESEHPRALHGRPTQEVVDHSLALCASTVSAGRCIGPRTFRKLKHPHTDGARRREGIEPTALRLALTDDDPDAVGWTTAGCSTRFTASFGAAPERRERAVLAVVSWHDVAAEPCIAFGMLAYCKHAEHPRARPPRRCPWRTPTSGGAAGPVAPAVPDERAHPSGRAPDPRRALRSCRPTAGRQGGPRAGRCRPPGRAARLVIVVDASVLANALMTAPTAPAHAIVSPTRATCVRRI